MGRFGGAEKTIFRGVSLRAEHSGRDRPCRVAEMTRQLLLHEFGALSAMTATLKAPGVYAISDSDPAWDTILRDCEERGSLMLEGNGKSTFKLEATTYDTRPKRPKMTSVPDFKMLQASLGSTKLTAEEEAVFFEAIRGE